MPAMDQLHLILASGSPRRMELLASAGYVFDVLISDAEETAPEGVEPAEVAKRNALAKAMALPEDKESLIIGADTIVVLDGHIFGKPANEEEATETLRQLSGRTHQVITGVALVNDNAFYSFAETTQVTFKQLSDQAIAAYVATGDCMDKAGAYGIQSGGGVLVERIQGDYDNVVGLPVARLSRMLEKLGVHPQR